GMAGAIVLAIDPMIFGGWLWRALPSRVMNLPILACMATIIGIAGRARGNVRVQIVLVTVVLILTAAALIASDVVGRVSYIVMLAAAVAIVRFADRST